MTLRQSGRWLSSHNSRNCSVLPETEVRCQVIEIAGNISDRDAVRAETLVAKHVKVLRKEWAKIHGEQRTKRN